MDCTTAKQSGAFDEATSCHGGPICNDCNEVTPRLAGVAKNALLNGDFPRVIAILDRLSFPTAGVRQIGTQKDESDATELLDTLVT